MTNNAVNICFGFVFLFILVIMLWFPKSTRPYELGVDDVHKEAFAHGFMKKIITDDDKVKYEWIK